MDGLDELHARFREHLYLPDPAIIDFTVATAVAARLGSDPLWALVVAPPSSGKTEVLQSVAELDKVHMLSSLTPSTLISGARQGENGRNPSLLMRLPSVGALLVLKDFGTILSMQRDARAEILAQLREVYDGEFTKEFGTGQSVTWRGRLGFVAGTTPSIDAHHAVINVLGERFLYFRVPEADRRVVASIAALTTRGDAMRAELSAAVKAFVQELDRALVPDIADRDDVRERLVSLADITTWARSAVIRDPYTKDIEVAPSPEGPSRFVKQLVALWRALETMGHRDAERLVHRVAMDSMPPARAAILQLLGTSPIVNTNEVRDVTRLSPTASKRVLEDMEALLLLVRVERGSGTRPGTWMLTESALRAWNAAQPQSLLTPNVGGEGDGESKGVLVPLHEESARDGWFTSLIEEAV